ncbi:hypothetical protein LAZ67_8003862 [Cordylochernes scorpioides]|uniref:Tetraspanin n=1 Tax=Cordylochernes scorpioides TaxID=51811 RepID=A0ABY6KRY3_9ARAC|nr:hypothetical protein LAZ67_8003862 [Cordylochernes scorpioides]
MVEGCAKFVKYGLYVANVIVLIGGIVVFSVGVWTLSDRTFMEPLLGSDLYVSSASILIATGVIVAVISFLGCFGAYKEVKCMLLTCADAFRMLTVAYGEATLDRSNVYRWYKMFSEGREDVNDEERAGRPSTSTTDEKINEVEKMILANRRITVRDVAEDLNISIGHSNFIND